MFQLPFAAAAQAAVRALRERGVLVDCRKACVRFGFGANHSLDDVGALLGALQGAAASAMPAA